MLTQVAGVVVSNLAKDDHADGMKGGAGVQVVPECRCG